MKKFDVALLVKQKYHTKEFANNREGFKQLDLWLKQKKCKDLHICMEATGCYGINLATYLQSKNYKVSIVNPARVKGFAKSELARVKTDKADAKLIAKFCMLMHPDIWLFLNI